MIAGPFEKTNTYVNGETAFMGDVKVRSRLFRRVLKSKLPSM